MRLPQLGGLLCGSLELIPMYSERIELLLGASTGSCPRSYSAWINQLPGYLLLSPTSCVQTFFCTYLVLTFAGVGDCFEVILSIAGSLPEFSPHLFCLFKCLLQVPNIPEEKLSNTSFYSSSSESDSLIWDLGKYLQNTNKVFIQLGFILNAHSESWHWNEFIYMCTYFTLSIVGESAKSK